jgi:plasmid stabilization system protein ParE
MKRRLRDDVVKDLTEAADWYDERRAGLGLRFLEAVEVTISRIEENPQLYRPLYRGLRRAILPRPFPYQVFFQIAGEHLDIYAVIHMARDPEEWKRRRGGGGAG